MESLSSLRRGVPVWGLFIEGWAFYCEELMEKLGYIDKPLLRLSRLNDQLWRAALDGAARRRWC